MLTHAIITSKKLEPRLKQADHTFLLVINHHHYWNGISSMYKRQLLLTLAATATLTTSPAFAEPEESVEKLEPFYGRLSPFYGRFSPFEGDVDPFWGRLSPFEDGDTQPFWGRISPFEGDVSSFWGRLSPFEDDELEPFWGRISPFWGRLSPFMGELQSNWGRLSPFDDTDPGDHLEVIGQLQFLLDESEAVWGERIEAETGKSFWNGFAKDVFDEFGIDLNDPSSLDDLSEVDRAAFQFAWYDGLMSFSGADHVDHWMETANWTPSLTQIQGMGSDTVIGLIDFSLTADADLQDNLMMWSGSDDPAGGHGGAVASLLVADHDGQGLMGIAPHASVALYNPFDEDGTADWSDITRGIVEVGNAGASVVNLSLGVPGATFDADWADVYSDPDVKALLDNTVFVHAAGNEGVEQMADINWDLDVDPSLIIVGSIGPNGSISGFSNTPGDACLVPKDNNHCDTYLMDRFIVAPGEWILVTDGNGGVTRMSGTSFSAPFVTGAIALLHDRWSWLKNHPEETANILFQTADDLGAPGVDPVYGWGALNITASQSPLDNALLYQLGYDKKGRETKNYLGGLGDKKISSLLNTEGGYVAVLEDLGDTYRDFLIPLDELTTGLGNTVNGTQEELQTYLSGSLNNVGTSTKGKNTKEKAMLGAFVVDSEVYALPLSEQRRLDGLNIASEFSLSSEDGLTFAFGNGVGAMSLSGDASAASYRFDPQNGGVNPILGFASGGAFMRTDVPVFGNATLSIGATERVFDDTYIDPDSGEMRLVSENIPTYQAEATHVSLQKPFGDTVTLGLGYTRLNEVDGALGTQSTLQGAFAAGTVTDAATFTANWNASERVSLSGSATIGSTHAADATNTLSIGRDGVTTTSFEASMTIAGLLTDDDVARFALVQPLHVESGNISVTTGEVIDRDTGALGSVTREFSLSADRRFAAEAMWGSHFGDDDAVTVSGFVRFEQQSEPQLEGEQQFGAKIQLRY